jgi:hypothetical protein
MVRQWEILCNPLTNLFRLVIFAKVKLKEQAREKLYGNLSFFSETISRSDGRSAVACAAYRSAEKLTCDYYGKEQDYTKIGVEHTQIYAPENTNINLLNRQKLWNTVEKVERRKDATLAREFEISLSFRTQCLTTAGHA